ncbi:MAG: hypothetical protein ACLS48_00015 [[Eubacterium] siraeum]
MVKAVNKLVLEINNTENEYFEKAIFYLRPELSCNSKLRSQAQLYLNKISLENRENSAVTASSLYNRYNFRHFGGALNFRRTAFCRHYMTASVLIFLM